uniref:Myb-like domain-containing protein n=2 Tax=Brassica oleracea TaxID=3712 RepID=A0A3P6EKY9_BRAOL|nr:unnamed protein product [Brassica oleracea]
MDLRVATILLSRFSTHLNLRLMMESRRHATVVVSLLMQHLTRVKTQGEEDMSDIQRQLRQLKDQGLAVMFLTARASKKQSQSPVDLDSYEPFWLGSQGPDESVVESVVKERRKWSPKEDKILIGAWLNTSKDAVVSNEQKAGAFWRRIVDYYNASPQLVGTIPREVGQCKQRWASINEQVSKFVGCYDAALREQRSEYLKMSSSSSDEVEERLNEIFDDILEDTYNDIVEAKTSKQRKQAYIERNREAGHSRLWDDYFTEDSTFSTYLFRRRFRMNKDLFLRLVHGLSENVPFFRQRRDATGRFGLSPLQKCTAAIRLLAYGTAADTVDKYLRLGESTALSCLHHFTDGIIQLFGDEYLRRPIPEDLQRLFDMGDKRGFPGMNCPTAWKGQYARGSGKPTIVLEAVASQDLWI